MYDFSHITLLRSRQALLFWVLPPHHAGCLQSPAAVVPFLHTVLPCQTCSRQRAHHLIVSGIQREKKCAKQLHIGLTVVEIQNLDWVYNWDVIKTMLPKTEVKTKTISSKSKTKFLTNPLLLCGPYWLCQYMYNLGFSSVHFSSCLITDIVTEQRQCSKIFTKIS